MTKEPLDLRGMPPGVLRNYTVKEIRAAVVAAGWAFPYMWEMKRAELVRKVEAFMEEHRAHQP